LQLLRRQLGLNWPLAMMSFVVLLKAIFDAQEAFPLSKGSIDYFIAIKRRHFDFTGPIDYWHPYF